MPTHDKITNKRGAERNFLNIVNRKCKNKKSAANILVLKIERVPLGWTETGMSVLVPIQHSHKDFIERNLAEKESDIQIRKKSNYLCSLSYTENVNKD